jgi:hypothetical protein
MTATNIVVTALEVRPSESNRTFSQCLPDIAQAIAGAGVARIRVSYDGREGFGDMEDPVMYAAGGKLMPTSLPEPMRRRLPRFLEDLLEMRHPDWEEAEGGRGDFEWHVASDKLVHLHGLRFIDYETTIIEDL